MARASKNADISSKNARKTLAVQTEPYWYSLGPGQHLGYRKQARSEATGLHATTRKSTEGDSKP